VRTKYQLGIAGLLVLFLIVVVLVGQRRPEPGPVAVPADNHLDRRAQGLGPETDVATPAGVSASTAAETNQATTEGRGSVEEAAAGPQPAEAQVSAEQLIQLSMNNDSASLQTILGQLRNPDRDMRKAALEATIQFGSRDALPSLADAAQQTADASEKAEILAAAEFLKLPSLSEVLAQGLSEAANQHSRPSQ
jgi:hypothetical protein